MRCPYVRGDGREMLYCVAVNKPCAYQHWCPHISMYELTTTSQKCSRRRAQDLKKK